MWFFFSLVNFCLISSKNLTSVTVFMVIFMWVVCIPRLTHVSLLHETRLRYFFDCFLFLLLFWEWKKNLNLNGAKTVNVYDAQVNSRMKSKHLSTCFFALTSNPVYVQVIHTYTHTNTFKLTFPYLEAGKSVLVGKM